MPPRSKMYRITNTDRLRARIEYAIGESVTAEDGVKAFKKLMQMAFNKNGAYNQKVELESLKLLLSYMIGKPVERKEITAPDFVNTGGKSDLSEYTNEDFEKLRTLVRRRIEGADPTPRGDGGGIAETVEGGIVEGGVVAEDVHT